MVVAHAGVAFLTVLIAPVGVVVVVAHQVVGLLHGGLLRSALRGCAEQGQRQAVPVVETFFDGGEIAVGIVVDPVDIGVPALARGEREGIGPAVVLVAGGIGDHGAEAVHLIGADDAGAQSLAHLRRAGDDVRRTADAAHAHLRGLQARGDLLVARGVVQTAPQRPGRVARHGVVELDAVHVDVLVLRVVAADVETHLAELVRRDVVEDVLRRRQRRGKRLGVVGRFGVELGEDRVVEHLLRRGRNEDDRVDVAHHAVHAHRDLQRLELGGLERERVFAGGDVLEEEVALGVRNGSRVARRHGHLHVVERHAARTRHDPSPDAALLRIGRERHERKRQNE